jgi:PAS domain S-box-containing protein
MGNNKPGTTSQELLANSLEQWLSEHHESLLSRWLDEGAAAYEGLLFGEAIDQSSLGCMLLQTLADRADAERLRDGWLATSPNETARLGLTAWHTLLEALRRSIVAELSTSTPTEQAFKLLLAVDEAFSNLFIQINRLYEQQLNQLAGERDHYKSLYAVTHEIATSLELDRVVRSALEGAIKSTGADTGVLFILDRESGRLFPWASVEWEVGPLRPESLPEDWTQAWRDEPVPPIGDIAALPSADWKDTLQVPSTVAGLIIAPIVTNGELYGLLVLGTQRINHFTADDVNVVKAITTQVAGVSENAEIYRLINCQAQQLGGMLRHQQEEASKSQAILESIADGVVVNNSYGNVILMNPAAERILRTPRDEVLNTDVRYLVEAFNDPGRTTAMAAIDQILAQANAPTEIKVASSTLEMDGQVINALMAPVVARHDEFLGVVTIFRDITKEVEADQAKSEFISTVSHELRTPMTAIKGYTDLLSGGAVGPLNDNQKHFLSVIKNNTDRLIALINDLLDISRIETGRIRFEPAPVKVGEIIADVVEAMAARAQARGLALTYEVDAGLPEVMGDRGRLYQVLTNLVGNAINYTPEGSITVEATIAGTAVQVSIRDTGVGIAPEDMSHIFDRFYRADDPVVQEASGTGLGLPIVKMFVEMHGGRVWVDSKRGEGSTFTFILPVSGAELEPKVHGPLASTPSPITARTVLVVDDDPDIAQLVRMQLENNGYRVLTASRGHKALNIAKEEKVDLIVLDRLLPEMDGLEVLDRLKSDPATSKIPIIMLTIVEDDGEAMARGASAYLVKPVNERLLLEQVDTVLTREGRVLIVEDDPDTIDMVTRVLRRVGFTTESARDGYEALAAARRVHPDVIIMDLRLPGMDGYEALSHLKRNITTGTIPIIAISAHVTNPVAEREHLIMLGATDFLLKPIAIEDLILTVDRAIEMGRVRKPPATPATQATRL